MPNPPPSIEWDVSIAVQSLTLRLADKRRFDITWAISKDGSQPETLFPDALMICHENFTDPIVHFEDLRKSIEEGVTGRYDESIALGVDDLLVCGGFTAAPPIQIRGRRRLRSGVRLGCPRALPSDPEVRQLNVIRVIYQKATSEDEDSVEEGGSVSVEFQTRMEDGKEVLVPNTSKIKDDFNGASSTLVKDWLMGHKETPEDVPGVTQAGSRVYSDLAQQVVDVIERGWGSEVAVSVMKELWESEEEERLRLMERLALGSQMYPPEV